MQCGMPLCESSSENFSTCGRITFHGFPSAPGLRAAWLKALGIQDSQLPDSAVVCSQHFLHDDICETGSGSTKLRIGAIPSTVLVCMICLNTDRKMSPISQYNLEEAYEKLTEHPLWDGGNLKQTLCVQCAQQLRNFSRFREQSLRARCLMMELLEKHEVITIQHIKMIQLANNKLKNNLVSMTLRPEPCDMFGNILGNSNVDKQTGSQESAHGVAVKAECSEDSQWKSENTREIKEENADCVSEEFDVELIKCGSAEFTCSVCCEQFPHEHAYSAHVRTHPAAPSPHTAGTIEVELSQIQDVGSHDSLYAHTSCEDAQYHAASEREVAATHNESAASVLIETEPGTSGHSSRTLIFICDVCEGTFTRRDNFVRHMRSHSGEKPYTCKICSYKCTEKSALVKHNMITHSGHKTYSCNICSFKFTLKVGFLQHMRTHSSEKLYSCETCSYRYTKDRLVRHMRRHTREKLYSCTICSYKSADNSHLVTHMRTHTGEKPYACEICGNKFSKKSSLVRHMRIHTGEKPYFCKICSYKCIENSSLVKHMRTHTGEKPYSCKICSYKCTDNSNLVKHMMTHTGAH